jgi:hypothetical protein
MFRIIAKDATQSDSNLSMRVGISQQIPVCGHHPEEEQADWQSLATPSYLCTWEELTEAIYA